MHVAAASEAEVAAEVAAATAAAPPAAYQLPSLPNPLEKVHLNLQVKNAHVATATAAREQVAAATAAVAATEGRELKLQVKNAHVAAGAEA